MNRQDHPVIGSWRLTIYPEAGTTPSDALCTFAADGTFISSPPAVEQFPLVPGGVVYVGTCHGVWQASDAHAMTARFIGQASDGQGVMVGMGHLHTHGELAADGQTFRGTYAFTMVDREGNQLATEDGTVQGTRIGLDAPDWAQPTVSPKAAIA